MMDGQTDQCTREQTLVVLALLLQLKNIFCLLKALKSALRFKTLRVKRLEERQARAKLDNYRETGRLWGKKKFCLKLMSIIC